MLGRLKKSHLSVVGRTHIDVFVEHYDVLKRWALKFTEHNHELAEDLLHDAFIQFTLNKPDLNSIQKLDAYLYVLMRNLHLSQMRKAARTPLRPTAAVEFDTIDMSFWASDPRERIRLRDELAAVCEYACIRKESAKLGSVLILRFFHGYYPEEIGKILGSNALAATKRLKAARDEARLYLESPDRLSFMDSKERPTRKQNISHFGDDLRLELRRQIFASRQGVCFIYEILAAKYGKPGLLMYDGASGLDHKTIAHVVSCPDCIEVVNSLLGLPSLASRYPLDTLGNDPGKNGGSGGSGGGPAGGPKMLDSFLNRREAHFHHQPEELCIAVNGQPQSFQKVVAGKGELTLVVDTDETLGFVEVFSEIGLRMLMLNVEPPPVGDGKQVAHVSLSGGRTLHANLNFSGPFPTLQVSYNDPELSGESVLEVTTEPNAEPAPSRVPFEGAATTITFKDRLRMWLEPMRIAVAATVLVSFIAAIWFVRQPATVDHPVARVVLKQARDAEFVLAPTAEKTLHRNYQVEEWSNGNLKSRRRIDEWQKPKATARRTYDEQGRMIAGKWMLENGRQQIFEQGQKLRTVTESESSYVSEPTANGFANLMDRHAVSDRLTIEESATSYTFNFEDRKGETFQAGISDRLIAANITLDKESLMPISQMLVLQIGYEVREYRFSDIRLEQRRASDVSPSIFFPEPELTRGATKVTAPILAPVPSAIANNLTPGNTASNTANPASAALEVEVVEALNNANAFMGEPVSVSRTGDGKILVTAMVETPARKLALLSALANFRSNSAVKLQIETVAEAQERINRRKSSGKTDQSISMESYEVTQGQNPVLAELRKSLSEDETRALSNRVISRARLVRQHALAAKQIAERFSTTEMSPAERSRWVALVRGHADRFLGELDGIRRELGPYFPEASSGASGISTIDSDAEIRDKVRELFQLASSLKSGLDRSFSVSAAGTGIMPVKTSGFWNEFSTAAGTARSLSAAR